MNLVSILINNYNYADFVGMAIESALSQSYANVEVIVVDDGSTDNSVEVIRGFGTAIKPVFKLNGGQASAFNAGFAQSSGQIICLLDADDQFSVDKCAEVVKTLSANPGAGWYFHPTELVRLDTGERTIEPPPIESGPCDGRALFRRGKVLFAGPATSGLCFRRDLLAQILPMPEVARTTLSDKYIKQLAIGLSPGYFAEKNLASRIIHGDNAFSAREDRSLLTANIAIQTAYWMHRNFPQFHHRAEREMAYGLTLAGDIKNLDDSTAAVAKAFRAEASLLSRLRVAAYVGGRRIVNAGRSIKRRWS